MRTSSGNLTCQGCFETYWNDFDLNTLYLARNDTNIFLAGTTGNSFYGLVGTTPYANWLYVLPGDGSCASKSCAIETISLPFVYPSPYDGVNPLARPVQVMSLAVGSIGQTPYLAVGLNDGGVQLYNVSNPSSPQLTGTFAAMTPTPYNGLQASVSALAWDPSGSGLLAVGVMSSKRIIAF